MQSQGWLQRASSADFKKEAAGQGISKRGLAALDGLSIDNGVLAADRRQGVFKQSFEQFSGRMISRDRLTKGAKLMTQHAATLNRIEQKYGVPGAVVVAIWGLETDYGVNQGKLSVVRSVATLAYDCRRTDKFQAELIDALRIVDRGDMASADMKGDWAGEIGQTQFLPSSYVKYAVNFDGRGHADLVHSAADVLASTANYLKEPRLAARPGLGPGPAEFRGDPGMEQGGSLRQDHRAVCRQARRRPHDQGRRSAPKISRCLAHQRPLRFSFQSSRFTLYGKLPTTICVKSARARARSSRRSAACAASDRSSHAQSR